LYSFRPHCLVNDRCASNPTGGRAHRPAPPACATLTLAKSRERERTTPMKIRILACLILALAAVAAAAPTPGLQVNPSTGETKEQFAERTQWWRDAKFGMFIHWGVYAVPADATDRQGNKRIAEWFFSNKQMQVKDYEKFAGQFNPVKFDARRWVKTAKDAGMKYIVITSKHHDGFCVFDSALTDYCITKATPFKRDPM